MEGVNEIIANIKQDQHVSIYEIWMPLPYNPDLARTIRLSPAFDIAVAESYYCTKFSVNGWPSFRSHYVC